jgi:hypothetical protein
LLEFIKAFLKRRAAYNLALPLMFVLIISDMRVIKNFAYKTKTLKLKMCEKVSTYSILFETLSD